MVLVDHTPGQERIIDILPGRSKERFVAWLRNQKGSGALSALEEVTCDLWEAYRQAVLEVLGFEATADRFHVEHQLHKRIDQTRREIQRRLPEKQKDDLKGMRWVLLKDRDDLSDSEKKRLQAVVEKFPEIGRLVDCREKLNAIFDDPKLDSIEKGKAALQSWIATARTLESTALDKFCETLIRWLDPVSRYFRSRASNGRTEGFNRGIRMLLSRCFGLPSFAHFRLRVLGVYG